MFRLVDRWDCIVIGGGIVGCAAAYYLSKIGIKSLIIEADGIASAQSGRNLGFIRQQGRDFREVPLAIEANAIWRTIEAELGRPVGWMQHGNVALAGNAELAATFESWTKRAREFDLDTRMIGAGELARLVPEMKGDFLGGMYTPSDGKADPVLATRAFFDAARQNGADAAIGSAVDEIVTSGGQVEGVRIGSMFLKSKTVICAAGAGTSRLLRKLGLLFPQDCIRATVLRTERTTTRLDVGIWALGIGVRQSRDGSIHMSNAGGEYDVRLDSLRYARWFWRPLKEKGSHIHLNFLGLPGRLINRRSYFSVADMPPSRARPKPSRRFAARAIDEFRQMFPALADLRILSAWAGYIENTPDLIPAVGPTKVARGLLVASGFSGHGFCPGPAAGKALAAMAAGQNAPASLGPLSPDRFIEGTWSHAASTL